jgi:hypothetical protein
MIICSCCSHGFQFQFQTIKILGPPETKKVYIYIGETYEDEFIASACERKKKKSQIRVQVAIPNSHEEFKQGKKNGYLKIY